MWPILTDEIRSLPMRLSASETSVPTNVSHVPP